MIHRPILAIVAILFFSLFAFAQQTATTSTSNGQSVSLPANTQVTDSKGRVVKNRGNNQNGSLRFNHTGKLVRNANGEWTVTGEISEVKNPASQGSDGPVEINTNGEPTDVVLDRNGQEPGGLTVTITGGNATVTVGGNCNDVTVGGSGNKAALNGNNNSLTGQAGSAGTATMGGHGNSVTSGGGSWRVGN